MILCCLGSLSPLFDIMKELIRMNKGLRGCNMLCAFAVFLVYIHALHSVSKAVLALL